MPLVAWMRACDDTWEFLFFLVGSRGRVGCVVSCRVCDDAFGFCFVGSRGGSGIEKRGRRKLLEWFFVHALVTPMSTGSW